MNNILVEKRNELLTLFTPGDGGEIPPYLAGREREKQFFRLAVYTLMEKHQGNQNMIVYGPRGNGKTCLLEDLASKTRENYGDKIDILSVTPDEITTPEMLEFWINTHEKPIMPVAETAEVKAGLPGFAGGVGVTFRQPGGVVTAIRKRCKDHHPVIMIVDEAHTLEDEVTRALFNASQTVRKENNPFFLVLAGTPGLLRTLGQANASFWERGEEFPLGRLSVEESVEALVKPLEPFGIPFANGVAEDVAIRAHCYPFFLQVWGRCLVEELVNRGRTTIDQYTVIHAEPKVIVRRNQMYAKRFNEIDDRELLPVAGKLARAFIANDNKPIPTPEINKLVGEREIVKTLDRLGYIWQLPVVAKGEKLSYEPGIPSMMNFVKEQTVGLVPLEKTKEIEPERDIGLDY